jgi:hypothetical protein
MKKKNVEERHTPAFFEETRTKQKHDGDCLVMLDPHNFIWILEAQLHLLEIHSDPWTIPPKK